MLQALIYLSYMYTTTLLGKYFGRENVYLILDKFRTVCWKRVVQGGLWHSSLTKKIITDPGYKYFVFPNHERYSFYTLNFNDLFLHKKKRLKKANSQVATSQGANIASRIPKSLSTDDYGSRKAFRSRVMKDNFLNLRFTEKTHHENTPVRLSWNVMLQQVILH